MAKWETVFTNGGKVGAKAGNQVTNKTLKTVKSKSAPQLKKEGDDLFIKKVAREDSLLGAFEEKKLKSKALIKETKGIKAKRDKKAAAVAKAAQA